MVPPAQSTFAECSCDVKGAFFLLGEHASVQMFPYVRGLQCSSGSGRGVQGRPAPSPLGIWGIGVGEGREFGHTSGPEIYSVSVSLLCLS